MANDKKELNFLLIIHFHFRIFLVEGVEGVTSANYRFPPTLCLTTIYQKYSCSIIAR